MSTVLPPDDSAAPLRPEDDPLLVDVLGYLNFSSGKPDAKFHRQLNELSRYFVPVRGRIPLASLLGQRLEELARTVPAFRDASQAMAVIPLTLERAIPAYHQFHADLLFHISPEQLLQPFFVARVFEAVLLQGGPWNETDRIVTGAVQHLNDFVGHRPVAVLENKRHTQPYEHERYRPIPLYLKGAGAAAGKYRELIERAIKVLEQTPPQVLEQAYFSLQRLDELAVDIRAYDSSHPVFKRTNYTFGEWDPHHIDGKGFYRRFVVRAIILDALNDWMRQTPELSEDEKLYEAAAVLAGTMLMASAVSGSGPDTHDSSVSLTALLPRIARQRDAFYSRLLGTLTGPIGDRLRKEAEKAQQPFGSIRQHLNLFLAHYSCRQMQRGHLALVYARMGFADAARQQAAVIPSTSARFETDIECRLASGHRHIDRSEFHDAVRQIVEIENLLERGQHCGAIVDPWNVLGFQGAFPLFTAREDSVPDNRIEKLLSIMEELFVLYSRLLAEVAAAGDKALTSQIAARFEDLAERWDVYATSTVSDLPTVNGHESYDSAMQVTRVLSEWCRAGESAGDLAFWKQHVGNFHSTKAYTMVVETLLRKGDTVAALNLLLQWLSEGDTVPLESNTHSYFPLLHRWLTLAERRSALGAAPATAGAASAASTSTATTAGAPVATDGTSAAGDSTGGVSRAATSPDGVSTAPSASGSSPSVTPPTSAPKSSASASTASDEMALADWEVIRKFFDAVEVNAGDYWNVPQFGVGNEGTPQLTDQGAGLSDDPFHTPVSEAERDGALPRRGADGETDGAKDPDDSDTYGDEGNLFQAAYDNVVFRDSAQDGHIGETMDTGPSGAQSGIELIGPKLEVRLKFLSSLMQGWMRAATGVRFGLVEQSPPTWTSPDTSSPAATGPNTAVPAPHPAPDSASAASAQSGASAAGEASSKKAKPTGSRSASAASRSSRAAGPDVAPPRPERELPSSVTDAIARWQNRTVEISAGLTRLVDQLNEFQPLTPSGDPDSLSEYDHELHTKFSLIHLVFNTLGTAFEASCVLASCLPEAKPSRPARLSQMVSDWPAPVSKAFRAMLRGDIAQIRERLPRLLKEMSRRPLLYVPLDKGGRPRDIIASRQLQIVLRFLLQHLPRLGLLRETWHVLRTAYLMERTSPPSGMSITEFDRLLQSAFRCSLEAVMWNARQWESEHDDDALFAKLEGVTGLYLNLWHKHNATMRLSSVEILRDQDTWKKVRAFIRRYGADLFHVRVLSLGNLRAILHRGGDEFLDYLAETDDPLHPNQLLEDLNQSISREEAVWQLELVLRCVIEKFDRFMEYNTTTTQSDYGEKLYCLLDFLRLETQYERLAWKMMPQVLVHEALARFGRTELAAKWRRMLEKQTGEHAKQHLKRLKKLESEYGMRLPSVTDRLNERFVKPMQLDRILALIDPALREAGTAANATTFETLRADIEQYLESSSGSAMELQPWLQSLTDEVQHHLRTAQGAIDIDLATFPTPRLAIPFEHLERDLKQWEKPLADE